MAKTETAQTELTALDWVVIVSATVVFILLATWIYQERHRKPPEQNSP